MHVIDRGFRVRAASGAGASILLLALAFGGAQAAEEKTYVMKVTLPT